MNEKEIYFQEPIEQIAEKVALWGERFILRNKEGIPMAAIVSMEELEILQALEN